jgi:hypothetical protein
MPQYISHRRFFLLRISTPVLAYGPISTVAGDKEVGENWVVQNAQTPEQSATNNPPRTIHFHSHRTAMIPNSLEISVLSLAVV